MAPGASGTAGPRWRCSAATPGSGKTRLANELARIAVVDGDGGAGDLPGLWAMGGAGWRPTSLRQLGPTGDDEVDVRLRSIAGEMDASLRSIEPVGMEQEKMWAFVRLMEKVADKPLLMVIDDAHRASERFLETINETGRACRKAPCSRFWRAVPIPQTGSPALPLPRKCGCRHSA